ncbi:conserved Plasmodium protein, unknown function [Plasmodium malariae]|uniref:5-formyltetrahydrofolate cyclo-ligase n=1 Tax=Plasmodium malariae TaxID=5858 RepID=A0A1D3TFM6_PLAMA|nr:conserved Plasmodium protein, unknown function [Plasmodium malariae]SCP03721.1 conserved Plasmodium protein, unknown function [Plasmodium malariae]
MNMLCSDDYKNSITTIDLNDCFKNCGNSTSNNSYTNGTISHSNNNRIIKCIVRENAKKIREIVFKHWITQKKDAFSQCAYTAETNFDEETKQSRLSRSTSGCTCGCKDVESNERTFYIDYLYTQLIRHMYIILSTLNVEKKEKGGEFNFSKIYSYTYNYKQIETRDAKEYLRYYGIHDFDQNFSFFTYYNACSSKNHGIKIEKDDKDKWDKTNDKKSNFNMCIYLPTKKEVDILFIIEKLYDFFYFDLYVPITTKENDLIFFPFDLANNLLVKHEFNIYVPFLYIYFNSQVKKEKRTFHLNSFNIVTDTLSYFTFEEKKTIFFIPLIAYNKYGCRVGSGKGYYDRTLKDKQHEEQRKKEQMKYQYSSCKEIETKKHIKIGLSFDIFLYDINFSEHTDITLDYIINEKNIFHFLF